MVSRGSARNQYILWLLLLLTLCGPAETVLATSHISTPASTPATLTQGQEGTAYSFTFVGSGGTTWSVSSGSLPSGLALNATAGVLSGTPTLAGTYNFTVRLRANSGTSDTCACTLVISPRCSFVGGVSNGSLSFGNIDPASANTLYGSVTQQVSLTCAAGTAYTITASPASGWTLASGGNTIPYTLGVAKSGTYAGTVVSLLVAPPDGGATAIKAADFQNAPAGTYANGSAVTITINYGTGSLTASVLSGGVSGTVIPTCNIAQTPGTLTFNMNPSVSGATSGAISPDLQIKCTKGTGFSVSASSACGGLSQTYPSCGGVIIPYSFGYAPGYTSGQGFGVAIPMNISGSVTSNNYQNAPVGSYGDLQTLTIAY